jgi:drug/metabolite transporter (DMT)-like permease
MFAIAGGIILGFLGIVVIVRAGYRRELRRMERDAGMPRGILSMSERQLDTWARVEAEGETEVRAKASRPTTEPMSINRILGICFGLLFLFGWAYLIWRHIASSGP